MKKYRNVDGEHIPERGNGTRRTQPRRNQNWRANAAQSGYRGPLPAPPLCYGLLVRVCAISQGSEQPGAPFSQAQTGPLLFTRREGVSRPHPATGPLGGKIRADHSREDRL